MNTLSDNAYTGPTRIYHRTQFLSTLQSHFSPNTRIHYRKRLVSYEDAAPDPVVLYFADGTHAKCDLVIGADGTKSAVRKAMFESLASKAQDEAQAQEYLSHVDAKWSGFVMYRALVQTDVLKEEYPDHVGLDRTTFVCISHTILVTFIADHDIYTQFLGKQRVRIRLLTPPLIVHTLVEGHHMFTNISRAFG